MYLRPGRHMLISSLLLALLLVLLILLALLVHPGNRAACIFDGCKISLIGDVEVLDRDRRALGLAYAPEASRRGEEGSEVVRGISSCGPDRRDA
jgi:hypothetical protein